MSSYKSPYATDYPRQDAVPEEVPLRKQYERVIKVRRITRLSSKGKHVTFDSWVIVGDRHGSAALANGKASQAYKATDRALQRARRTMKHYEFYEGRTLYHDITTQLHTLRLRLMTKAPGYSVRAQSVVHDVFQALGVKDVNAKIMQGTTNPITIAKAVFNALDKHHKTPTQVAQARGKRVEQVSGAGVL